MQTKHWLLFAVVLLALVAVSSAFRFRGERIHRLKDTTTSRSFFNTWSRAKNRSYDSEQFGFRYKTWRDNVALVDHFNAKKNASYEMGINDFTDLSATEVQRLYTGELRRVNDLGDDDDDDDDSDDDDDDNTPNVDNDNDEVDEDDDSTWHNMESRRRKKASPSPSRAPKPSNNDDNNSGGGDKADPNAANFDWRTKGAVVPIKNQGSCGSCYAFAVAAGIEGAIFRGTGKLASLSEQAIVDCSSSIGNNGCNGGYTAKTFKWVISTYGGKLPTTASYPYKTKKGSCLSSSASMSSAGISSYYNIPAGNANTLLQKAAIGPVPVAIYAGSTFSRYSKGVYDDTAGCAGKSTNHAITVVGWGVDSSSNQKYWIIRNSWGANWGMSGYINFKRGINLCQVEKAASQPCYKSDCSM